MKNFYLHPFLSHWNNEVPRVQVLWLRHVSDVSFIGDDVKSSTLPKAHCSVVGTAEASDVVIILVGAVDHHCLIHCCC
jgi:hypothetical protein